MRSGSKNLRNLDSLSSFLSVSYSRRERASVITYSLPGVTVGLAAAGSWREYGETVQIQSATEVLSIGIG